MPVTTPKEPKKESRGGSVAVGGDRHFGFRREDDVAGVGRGDELVRTAVRQVVAAGRLADGAVWAAFAGRS